MFSFKQLIAGIVLLLLIGVAAFFYRNTMERPLTPAPGQTACTMEARLCPDGSSVGRTGPNCEFQACAFPPNVEIPTASLSFAIPAGYSKGVQEPGADGMVESMLDFYERPAQGNGPAHFITVYSFPIPAGQTAESVILAHTRYQPSDMQATDMSKFAIKIINGRTFRATTIERFEGQVTSAYYLPRANDVLRFDVVERDVTNWTDPNLVIDSLPEHAALIKMLAGIQTP